MSKEFFESSTREAVQMGVEMRHSCELSVDKNGLISGSIKVYGLFPFDARIECQEQFLLLLDFIERIKKDREEKQ